MSIYSQLERECLPQIAHYQNDILVYDKELIEANPGVPFLHWTHDCGTTIVFLPTADDECYPPYGVSVPYLFGTADREHILHGKVTIAEYHTRPINGPHRYTCRYYNGKTLRVISVEEAVKIAKDYARPIQSKWHTEWLKHSRPYEYRAMREANLVS